MISPLPSDRVIALTRLVELKDHCTAAHTWRVSLYTQALAEEMGVEQPVIYRMMRAAAVHDLGKLDIPAEILTKPGPLTDEERAIMRTHPDLGHRRLIELGEDDPLVLELVRSHHERIDGSGYGDGLRGDAIPFIARLFAVVDSFDAMTSIRPYRRQTGEQAAKSAIVEIKSRAGTWYCPDAVAAFVRLHEGGALKWIQKHFNDQKSLDGLRTPATIEELSGEARRVGR